MAKFQNWLSLSEFTKIYLVLLVRRCRKCGWTVFMAKILLNYYRLGLLFCIASNCWWPRKNIKVFLWIYNFWKRLVYCGLSVIFSTFSVRLGCLSQLIGNLILQALTAYLLLVPNHQLSKQPDWQMSIGAFSLSAISIERSLQRNETRIIHIFYFCKIRTTIVILYIAWCRNSIHSRWKHFIWLFV